MLPPPTTIAISTPRSPRAFVTSSAMRCTTTASMPNPIFWSANASPESFSTTRWYRLAVIGNSSRAELVVERREPPEALFLSDLDPRESTDVRVGPEGLHHGVDRLLVVLDERLLDECDRLEEAVELAVDDLRPGLLGLALFLGLCLVDIALACDFLGRHFVARDVTGRRARDVQRDVVCDCSQLVVVGVDATELDDHADRAALVLDVLVAVEQAVGGLEPEDAAQLDLLSERAGQPLHVVVDAFAGDLLRAQVDVI